MNDDRLPKLGDLVKMKIDEDRGLVGVVHKIRTLPAIHADPRRGCEVYDITWPDVRSVQYLSEIRVISRS